MGKVYLGTHDFSGATVSGAGGLSWGDTITAAAGTGIGITNTGTATAIVVTATSNGDGLVVNYGAAADASTNGVKIDNASTSAPEGNNLMLGVSYSMSYDGFSNNTRSMVDFYHNRNNTAAAGTLTDTWKVLNVRSNARQNTGGGTYVYSGRALNIEHTALEQAGTLEDTSHALYVDHETHYDGAETWAVYISHDNEGTAAAGGIDMSSFSAGENLLKVPTDATDPTGAGAAADGRIAVSVAGVASYLAYYTA